MHTGPRPRSAPTISSRASFVALVLVGLGCSPELDHADRRVEVIDLRLLSRVALQDSFTYVSSVRPLKDGSILVTDPREQRVERHRFDGSQGEPVSRQGLGPAEWSRAVELVSACNDRSLQYDPAALRLHLYERERLIRVFPPDLTPPVGALLAGAHGDSAVVFVKPPAPPTAGGLDLRFGESLAVVRVLLRDLSMDTATMLRDAPGRIARAPDESGELKPVALARPAFAAGEQAAAFCDGTIAVVRLDPYRIEWRAPDGQVIVGAPLDDAPRELTPSMKNAYLRATVRQREAIRSAPPAIRSALLARYEEFPTHLPPIDAFALIAADDSLLYVRKPWLPTDSVRQYDVFRRGGVRVATLTMPPNERLLAATPGHWFTVMTGEMDEEVVVRYERPSTSPVRK